jgi:hypothetical protein
MPGQPKPATDEQPPRQGPRPVFLAILVGLGVAALACLGVGGWLVGTHRRGYTSEAHRVDAVDCKAVSGLTCSGTRWWFTTHTTCHAQTRCGVSGDGFGTLERVYRDGRQPKPGD